MLIGRRDCFEAEKLVFADGGWYAPSSCLWTSSIDISWMVTIGTAYALPGLEPFFLVHLHVRAADMEILTKELIQKATATAEPDITEMKKVIMVIGSMFNQDTTNEEYKGLLSHLQNVNFVPVRNGDAEAELHSIASDFAIVDHTRYAEAFRDCAAFLDFDIEEVRVLHPLLMLFGLEQRLLSRAVKEDALYNGVNIKNEALTEDLRRRSYALCW
jgi:hypothetical protein